MIDYDYITKENIEEHNENWPQIFDHLHRILIIGGPISGKAHALLSLVEQQKDNGCDIIDKSYLYVKNPNEAK